MISEKFQKEVVEQERFEFGKNWQRFLSTLTEERITSAMDSLRNSLSLSSLEGKTFLDIGCGSGLFSLAAVRLGAESVYSIDYDTQSVACAEELKSKFYSQADRWQIEQASALDSDYLKKLGQWDVVYSWGVLHHTGAMWDALTNVIPLVNDRGALYISIYNDQGNKSKRWLKVKEIYNKLPYTLRTPYVVATLLPGELYFFLRCLLKMNLGRYIDTWKHYPSGGRGMNRWYDAVDWVGGYPFEVAKPEEIFDFYTQHGFALRKLKTCGGGLGCNEFVFQKVAE